MGDDKVYAVIVDTAKRHIIVGQKAQNNKLGKVSNFLLNMPNILGGTIDKGETPLQALIREIQEESGDLMDATSLTALPNTLIPAENGNNKNGPYTMNFYQVDVSMLKKFGIGDNNWIKTNTGTKYGQLEMLTTFAVDFSGMDPANTNDDQVTNHILKAMGLTGASLADKTQFITSGTFRAIRAAFAAFPFP